MCGTSGATLGRLVRRHAMAAVLLAALAAVVGGAVNEAYRTPTFCLDEPLWFMRSSVVAPAHVCTKRSAEWAIDVPGANRWLYFVALKATGQDRVPRGEPVGWNLDGAGHLRWNGWRCPPHWLSGGYFCSTLDEWKDKFGLYGPRKAIMVMRFVNITAFAVMLVGLWHAARTMLRSPLYAGVAVLPVALSPTIATHTAIVTWSGDIFMLAAQAVALAAWTAYHAKGKGTTPMAVFFVSVVAGAAVGSKLNGVLVLAAFMVYLALYSHRWQRALNPALAAVIAFLVFCAINPVVFLNPYAGPLEVCTMFARQRLSVAASVTAVLGRPGTMEFTRKLAALVYWWPIVPLALPVVLACRQKAWFPVLALWGSFIAAGTVAGWYDLRMAQERYLAPLEESTLFAVAVCVLALALDARRLKRGA